MRIITFNGEIDLPAELILKLKTIHNCIIDTGATTVELHFISTESLQHILDFHNDPTTAFTLQVAIDLADVVNFLNYEELLNILCIFIADNID